MPPEHAPVAVRLPADAWRAYAAGLRAHPHPLAARLLPRVEGAAAQPADTDLVLTAAERSLLRDIDQRAADALLPQRRLRPPWATRKTGR